MPFMRLTTKRRSFVFATVAISQICASPQTHAQAPGLTETAQKSIAYIYFDVIDPNTGAKSTIQGTGFVVSKNGYVLTASHLFRAWWKQRDVDKANNPIKGTLRDKVGSVPESPRNLQIVNAGDPDAEDVALLKLPYSGTEAYPTAAICVSKAAAAKPGDNLLAFGFPLDQNFQPVPATLGTQNAPGGRWAAASAFTEGMSGGPVYSLEGFVVGLVKGGLDSQAVRWITPIQYAARNLSAAIGFVERCDCSPPRPTEYNALLTSFDKFVFATENLQELLIKQLTNKTAITPSVMEYNDFITDLRANESSTLQSMEINSDKQRMAQFEKIMNLVKKIDTSVHGLNDELARLDTKKKISPHRATATANEITPLLAELKDSITKFRAVGCSE